MYTYDNPGVSPDTLLLIRRGYEILPEEQMSVYRRLMKAWELEYDKDPNKLLALFDAGRWLGRWEHTYEGAKDITCSKEVLQHLEQFLYDILNERVMLCLG